MGVILAVVPGFVLVGVLVVGCLVALLLPAINSARTAARRAQSTNNLKQIALAVHMYHDTYNEFPPAIVRDKDGNPLYSGRVLLLPFIEQGHIYDQWKKDEAWNSPNNAPLSKAVIGVFKDPNNDNPSSAETSYLFITGRSTAFEELAPPKKMTFSEFTDGTSNTILAIEVKGSGVNWAEPKDIDIGSAWPQPGNYPGKVLVMFADGSVRTMDLSNGDFKAMATRNGGEVVNPY
jgi:hypothetical protein